MRIAVTGTRGQVALALMERARTLPEVEVVALGRPDLDLARPETIWPALASSRPDLVVSAAAYTAVDRAEDEPELAHSINGTGAGAVATAAARLGAPVIHLSTDYVFDGKSQGAYQETDAPAPLNVYGLSKRAGEMAVAAATTRHLILRTSWVYSPFGTNFAKTMLRLARERTEIAVVSDQRGHPSSALDLADGILRAALALDDGVAYGIYHLAGTGTASWADFARQVFSASRALGGPWAEVRDIAAADYAAPAPRPSNTQLCCAKFGSAFGWTMPHWRQSVDAVVSRILGEAGGGHRPAGDIVDGQVPVGS
ncbi:dTDP-4-dehydrorhamnose reductase [Mycoplana sp. MJR14]|uniref:dTDP-4-dehydrorhamnose reductase n=1 Tax=Mycoplana sp. MJR14 TaxID=3032583 RepID=UPI0023DC4944|nr:dTDP-4-dehydrorhamnose reductase [Mycoplana sp. MJR14]MDF1635341.1 dTDP-4-dehydrorhamnose reductase [Mycoplana sp. MJR14]